MKDVTNANFLLTNMGIYIYTYKRSSKVNSFMGLGVVS